MFIAGIACIVAGVALGEGKAGIFIVFPFIYGSGILMLAGMLLVFFSFPLFMLSQTDGIDGHSAEYGEYRDTRTDKHAGGLILIGPIPIVISSDKNIAIILMAAGMIFALIFFLAYFLTIMK